LTILFVITFSLLWSNKGHTPCKSAQSALRFRLIRQAVPEPRRQPLARIAGKHLQSRERQDHSRAEQAKLIPIPSEISTRGLAAKSSSCA
jgi:hypothetical protein